MEAIPEAILKLRLDFFIYVANAMTEFLKLWIETFQVDV